MLLTVADFRESVRRDMESLVVRLQALTGRGGLEEAEAWRASLPKLAEVLDVPELSTVHVYLAGAGYLASNTNCPQQRLLQAYRILLTRGIHGTYLWFEDGETQSYVRRCLGE